MTAANMKGRVTFSRGLDHWDNNPFDPYHESQSWIEFQQGYLEAANFIRHMCNLSPFKSIEELAYHLR